MLTSYSYVVRDLRTTIQSILLQLRSIRRRPDRVRHLCANKGVVAGGLRLKDDVLRLRLERLHDADHEEHCLACVLLHNQVMHMVYAHGMGPPQHVPAMLFSTELKTLPKRNFPLQRSSIRRNVRVQKSPFFRLPQELRNVIYEYVLLPELNIEPLESYVHASRLPGVPIAFTSPEKGVGTLVRRPICVTEPALTSTCYQIRSEARPMFYSGSIFILPKPVGDHLESVEAWLDAIGAENIARLRRVVVEKQDLLPSRLQSIKIGLDLQDPAAVHVAPLPHYELPNQRGWSRLATIEDEIRGAVCTMIKKRPCDTVTQCKFMDLLEDIMEIDLTRSSDLQRGESLLASS